MDFLEKLDYLMQKQNLNKNTLSKACDIPYTTIDGWYKKGYEGLKLTTLRKLANFFNTPLDFWANDDIQPTDTLEGYSKTCNCCEEKETAPDTEEPLTEAEIQDFAMQLYRAMVGAGLMKPGQELTEPQMKALESIAYIASTFFDNPK